jgi:cyclic pyranopterin monophosphate synthase
LEANLLTHINQKNHPTMVDITSKEESSRMAMASTEVYLPSLFREYFTGEDLILKKGPVFQTAIIAATMAVKRTYEIIPFCHQIPIESCQVEIEMNRDLVVSIICRVKTNYKTGVEMEALHGASVAALTIFDMCKALSSDIVIGKTELIHKTGGKKTKLDRPVFGLVLTGGRSERMGFPKALINYKGLPHGEYLYKELSSVCDQVFLSARSGQWEETVLSRLPTIFDDEKYSGPMAALLTAFAAHPEVNWFVVACDLPHFNRHFAEKIFAHYQSDKVATCFANPRAGFPEALCALYTPHAHEIFLKAHTQGIKCPVKALKEASIELIQPEAGVNLANINTPQERDHEAY